MFCENKTIGIQIKFGWSRKRHLKLNIIRDEIRIMNFCRPLMVILWCWHEASISNFCDDMVLNDKKKKKKKKKEKNLTMSFVISMDREVLIKAKHGC